MSFRRNSSKQMRNEKLGKLYPLFFLLSSTILDWVGNTICSLYKRNVCGEGDHRRTPGYFLPNRSWWEKNAEFNENEEARMPKNWSNFFFPSRSYKLCQHQPLPPLIPQLFGTHPQVYLWAISRQVNRTNQDFELHFLLSCLDNQANGKPCPISSLTQFTSPILCPAVISTPRNFDFTPWVK